MHFSTSFIKVLCPLEPLHYSDSLIDIFGGLTVLLIFKLFNETPETADRVNQSASLATRL